MSDQRKKGERLPQGAPRRLTDARCAWRGMDAAQRREFLAWIDPENSDDIGEYLEAIDDKKQAAR